ncbi:hypothetical protein BG418_19520 [Streptomyces sp. CBMA152]|nr:hypothetical protein [Streptomyces sp. CBMA152]
MAFLPGRRRHTARLFGVTLAAILGVGAVNGCSPSGSSHPPADSHTASVPPKTVTLDEHARGTVVRVSVGAAVLVRLHSTYWSVPTSSDPQVLAPVGKGGSTPATTCPPGAGCGLAVADFTARHPGTAHLSAHRNSCGEAMPCRPGDGSYTVTVEIT